MALPIIGEIVRASTIYPYLAVSLTFDLDLSRFRSGQVLTLCGPLFEDHGGFPADC